MTVVVACRTADGTLVFGADQRCTSDNEIRDVKKLSFHPMLKGMTLMGMAAENVVHAFAHENEIRIALNHVTTDQDPVLMIQERIDDPDSFVAQNKAADDVAILCGIATSALHKPKLCGIFGRKTRDLDEKAICCIGSGAWVARGFLGLVSQSLLSLRDVQLAVCASIWLAKRMDPGCGGATDIGWLNRDTSWKELEVEDIKAWEGYIETTLSEPIARWLANAPSIAPLLPLS